MKRAAILLLVSIASIGASWAAFQALAPDEPPLSRYIPVGSLLYLQARDFSALVGDWNASPQKASWVKSKNYEVYSRSRLFLRLQGAGEQFAAAASLPPDMNFLTQVAGTQSALALYDIGKLEFLYITKLPSAGSMQSALWQTRTSSWPVAGTAPSKPSNGGPNPWLPLALQAICAWSSIWKRSCPAPISVPTGFSAISQT